MIAVHLVWMLAVAADPAPAAPFPRIANCYDVKLFPESTPADIDEIARFDLLIGGAWCNWENKPHRELLYDKMKEVRDKNPHVIILEFSSSAPYAYPQDAQFPGDGWLKQANRGRLAGWPGTDMINLLKPKTLDWVVGRSVRSVRDRQFDGTFIDCMAGTFDWWACNIKSGEPYTIDADEDGKPDEREFLNHAWMTAKTEIVRDVREEIGPDVPFMANQAGDWGKPYLNGILLEDYLDYVLDGQMTWRHVLDTYLAWTRVAHRPNITTIVSSSGIEPPFEAWQTMDQAGQNALLERGYNRKQRMRFGLTTTLMGDGYYAYDLHTRWRGQRWWYPEYDAPLGYPRGDAAEQPDGTWRREFTGGTVVVNPTVFDAPVGFDAPHKDVSSGQVGLEFLVPVNDGRVFLPTTEPPSPGALPDPTPTFARDGNPTVLQRDGMTFLRSGRVGALVHDSGRLMRLSNGPENLVENLRLYLVADAQWRDFAVEIGPTDTTELSSALFMGVRRDGEAKVRFKEHVVSEGSGVTFSFTWEAQSDLNLYSARLTMDLPLSEYLGGFYRIDDAAKKFPAETPTEAILEDKARRFEVSTERGTKTVIETSRDAQLVDERRYNTPAFRITIPLEGKLIAGEKHECLVRIRVDQRGV